MISTFANNLWISAEHIGALNLTNSYIYMYVNSQIASHSKFASKCSIQFKDFVMDIDN